MPVYSTSQLMRYLFSLFLLSIPSLLFGQVEVTYRMFNTTEGPPESAAQKEIQSSYMHYIIGDNTYALITETDEWITVYDPDANILNILHANGEVTERDGADNQGMVSRFEKVDSVFDYRGHQAYLVREFTDLYQADHIYSVKQYYDHKPYKKHQYVNWNDMLKISKGSLLLHSTHYSDDQKFILEYVSITDTQLKNDDFTIEGIRRLWSARNTKMYREVTDKARGTESDYLKLTGANTIRMKGKMSQGQFHMPVEIELMKPDYMLMQLSFMNTSYIVLRDSSHIYTFDPMENVVTKASTDDPDNSASNMDWFGDLSSGTSTLDPDSSLQFVTDLEIDSLHLRRIGFFRDKKNKVDYRDLETGVTKLIVEDEAADLYLRPASYGDIMFPSMIQSVDEGFAMVFEEIEIDYPQDISRFQLPDSLKNLIQEVQVTVTAEDYYNRAEAQMDHADIADSLEASIANYKEAIRMDAGNSLYLNQLGNAYYYKADFYSALVNYKQAVDNDPGNAVAWRNLASIKWELDSYDDALEDINRSLALSPEYADALAKRGDIYYALGEMEKSKDDYHAAYIQDPSNIDYAGNAGILYYKISEYDSSLYFLNKADSLGDLDGSYLNYLGLAYYQKENFEKALEKFDLVFRKFPEVENGPYNRAYTLNELGRIDEAIAGYEAILVTDSLNSGVLDNLGLIYYEQEDYQGAVPYFKRAVKVEPTEATYYDHLGNSYFHMMRYTDAISAYNKSINIYPEDPVIYFNRGISKIRINDNFDGCKDLRQAIELGSENAESAFTNNCSFLGE